MNRVCAGSGLYYFSFEQHVDTGKLACVQQLHRDFQQRLRPMKVALI
jgi:hypothetical protein